PKRNNSRPVASAQEVCLRDALSLDSTAVGSAGISHPLPRRDAAGIASAGKNEFAHWVTEPPARSRPYQPVGAFVLERRPAAIWPQGPNGVSKHQRETGRNRHCIGENLGHDLRTGWMELPFMARLHRHKDLATFPPPGIWLWTF